MARTNTHHPNTYTRTCTHCDHVFYSARPTAKYCSDACKQAAYRRRIDPDTGSTKRATERATHAAETKATQVHIRYCHSCGKRITADGNRAPRLKYCSDACKQAAYRQRKVQHDELVTISTNAHTPNQRLLDML